MRVVPFYAASHARWGLPSLVGLLDRAARRVARRYPDAVLGVGDLSRKGGGELDRHRSHESGRDADVAFFARSAGNKPLVAERFIAFGGNGGARSMPGAVFDDVRNWALIEALLEDVDSRVSHIFVASTLRARLLRYAEQHGVARPLRERAAEVMMQPRHALPHDDHFHIRIACPPAQVGTCVEDAVLLVPRAKPMLAGFRHRGGSPEARPSLRASAAPPLAELAQAGRVGSKLAALPAARGPREEEGAPALTVPTRSSVDGVTQVTERGARGSTSWQSLANAPAADTVDR